VLLENPLFWQNILPTHTQAEHPLRNDIWKVTDMTHCDHIRPEDTLSCIYPCIIYVSMYVSMYVCIYLSKLYYKTGTLGSHLAWKGWSNVIWCFWLCANYCDLFRFIKNIKRWERERERENLFDCVSITIKPQKQQMGTKQTSARSETNVCKCVLGWISFRP